MSLLRLIWAACAIGFIFAAFKGFSNYKSHETPLVPILGGVVSVWLAIEFAAAALNIAGPMVRIIFGSN